MHVLQEQSVNNSLLQVAEAGSAQLSSTNQQASGDAFDGSAEPRMYMSENRMAATVELTSVLVCVLFAGLVAALLFVLPGVRKTKFASLICLPVYLAAGATIFLALGGCNWLAGSLQLKELPYSALTPSQAISGRLQVNIGLMSANVTLVGSLKRWESHPPTDNQTSADSSSTAATHELKQVHYNERFSWDRADQMADEHLAALRRGLPYPILTVSEFFSQDKDGFNWQRQFRRAGYFSSLALYCSLASWCLGALIMCQLPVCLAHVLQMTGALMVTSVTIYALMIPSQEALKHGLYMSGKPIEFSFGLHYMALLGVGSATLVVGAVLLVLQASRHDPAAPLTIMDSEKYLSDRKALQAPAICSITKNQNLDCQTIEPNQFSDLEPKSTVVIPIANVA